MFRNLKKIYMDYAASTSVDLRVFKAMEPYFATHFGNPSSLHQFGQIASSAIFEARGAIADSLGADYKEIIFTGGATEANNLVLRGVLKATSLGKPKIIVSAIEHESILETARDLEQEGVEVVYLPVSREGIVDLEKLKLFLDERTVLVSVMYANNEIGMIQPIQEIAGIIREFKDKITNKNFKESDAQKSITYPLFHTDACQAFQYLNCKPDELGVDFLTLSAHKIYGPKGIGVLYQKLNIKNKISKSEILTPIITGATQERGFRAGTENVPYIVGFAEAIKLTDKLRDKESKRVEGLRDYLWQELKKGIDGIDLNGLLENRLPNNLNIYFPGYKAHELLIALDVSGVAASAGSACHSRTTEPSATIMAMGYSKERASGSLRFSLGRQTTKAEIDKLIKILANVIKVK